MRLTILALLLLTLSAVARPPNVIFILTNDQGWGDGKFARHPYVKKPNLDRLAYSTGRLMEPADEFAVDRLYAQAKQQGLGLRSLVIACLTSEVFRSR